MRILLVTFSEYLPFALTKVLNPELEYCAIVVDEPDISKNMFKDYPQITNVIFPFYELKECVNNVYYDLAISISLGAEILSTELRKYGVQQNKLIPLTALHTPDNFYLERAFRYYVKNKEKFYMFATGLSYVQHGLIPKLFSRKIFNFGRASQDLYYDYQIAKYVLEVCRGGAY